VSPIKRGGVYYLYIPRQKGGRPVLRTAGTTDPRLYRLMKLMVKRLKDERRWPLLNAVIDGRLTVGQVFDADRTKALDALEASLSAQALGPHVTAYLASAKGRGLAPRNLENIKRQLDAFCTVATTTQDLTPAVVTKWLADMATTPGTRRQYLYAVTGFTRYLVDTGVLADYPLTRVKAPKKNPARMTYHDAATDERIVQAASPRYRAMFAFIKGTGCDVSTALNIYGADFSNGTVRLRGTKTAQRDVHEALIEEWAWPYILDGTRHILAGQLWAGLTRSGAYHHHARCCEALGITGYTLKDSRHSVAVRMAKAGYTVQEIAEQLGNSPELVARVYARFIPRMQHRVTSSVTEAKNA
jgi:integrase